jgi:predicted ester cyclase
MLSCDRGLQFDGEGDGRCEAGGVRKELHRGVVQPERGQRIRVLLRERSLKINHGAPSVGRTAITAAAQGFMTAFPDMVVAMDSVSLDGRRAVYRWTLTGTNTGPGGTGKAVRISGYEEWTFGAEGLIAESKGHFDETDYNRQLGK